ncbi:hypothetical protein [Agarivorans sp. DSG3-1]|uniref:hypothetical protein n=1 Tax=Agarivorans sp. DSG3-1 TaxID=3342249 RepID=UPI00398F53D3
MMKAILAVSILLALSACSNSQHKGASNAPEGQQPLSQEQSGLIQEVEPSHSSVDTIGANADTSDVYMSSIEPEVDAMFEQLIVQAVADGDHQKALRFVQDAEQAGSIKARKIYEDAVKAQP